MARTQIVSSQLGNGEVKRADLNTATSGSAVITKLIQGTGISLSSTGADAGTGAVTVNVANVSATQRVIGRNTAGSGAQEEVTVTQVLDWVSNTRGTILYRGAAGWAALSPGTAGYVLQSNGSGADPSWVPMAVDLSTYHLVSAASTNAAVVKASAGKLYGWFITNTNASARKLAFHNTASTPTAGASVFFSLLLPGGGAANVLTGDPIVFSTGIAITTVTEAADNGTTAVAAGDLIINLFYV